MRSLIVVAISCVGFISCFAQRKGVYRMHKFGDTTIKYGWTPEMFERLGMPQLKKSNKPFYFRFSDEVIAVDIWSDDSIHHHARLFCFTNNNKRKTKYFGMCFPVSDSIADRIVTLYYSLEISKIPGEDSIKGYSYNYVIDGMCYKYEYSNGSEYVKKLYCNPDAFRKTIKETQVIDSFDNYLEANVNWNESFNSLINQVPAGTYTKGMIGIRKFWVGD